MRIPSSSRRVASLALFAIGSVGAVAIAQTRKPKPKPPVADAGADNPYGAEGSAAGSNGQGASPSDGGVTPMVGDASGPVPPPAMLHGEYGDGGVRPSPLNPAPNEFSQNSAALDAGSTSGVDYDKLIADITSLRARVAAVGDTLFHSRIAIQVRTDGDHGRIGRLVVSLDDGAVYTAPINFRADDWTPVYAHALAAGHHAITVDVERKDDRNDGFRNSQRSRFTVEVPRDQELGVQIKIGDDSDMGKDFPSDKEGSYDLRVRVKAEAHAAGKK